MGGCHPPCPLDPPLVYVFAGVKGFNSRNRLAYLTLARASKRVNPRLPGGIIRHLLVVIRLSSGYKGKGGKDSRREKKNHNIIFAGRASPR